MLNQAPGYLAAFTAGLLSFLTPCVLPLVPGYISFISGVSLSELSGQESKKFKNLASVLGTTLFFVLGFSLVFSALGVSAHKLIELFPGYKSLLIRVGGLAVIVLGLHMAGVFKIEALYRERRFQAGAGGSRLKAFVLGVAFAFGWTPCVGPILGGILGLAAFQEKTGQALSLMLFYCAGMALPFFLTGLMVETFFRAFERVKPHFRKIEIAAGVLLIIIGVMMATDSFSLLKVFFQWLLPEKVNLWG